MSLCGVSRKQAEQQLQSLSGGEQARVKLCLLKLSPSNFLILDEPTNHLDKEAKESLKRGLRDFRGTVLLVTHEEEFCQGGLIGLLMLEDLITYKSQEFASFNCFLCCREIMKASE